MIDILANVVPMQPTFKPSYSFSMYMTKKGEGRRKPSLNPILQLISLVDVLKLGNDTLI